jgi:hypothetical protein
MVPQCQFAQDVGDQQIFQQAATLSSVTTVSTATRSSTKRIGELAVTPAGRNRRDSQITCKTCSASGTAEGSSGESRASPLQLIRTFCAMWSGRYSVETCKESDIFVGDPSCLSQSHPRWSCSLDSESRLPEIARGTLDTCVVEPSHNLLLQQFSFLL